MDEQQKKLAEELLFSGEQKPGFAKMLYFGLLDTSKVFPFPDISKEENEETDEILRRLDAFAKEKIDADAIDRKGEIPAEVIRGLGELGILGMTVPKEYGGLAMSQHAYCRVMERLAQLCSSTALFVNAHHSIGLRALLLFGTDAQKAKWLKPLSKGDVVAAFSLTEPTAGSDAAGILTKAEHLKEEKVYRINGQKQWTTNGSLAGVLTVMAKTKVGDTEKITAFLVTPDMPGFKVKAKALEKVGMRGTWTSNLGFENMDVPEENILGPIGAGLRVCLTVLDFGRTTFGATCTGLAKYLYKRALDHATTRYQFGRPLASFPLVKRKLARMAAHVLAMESSTFLTAGLLDTGEKDIMIESAILKVFNSDSLWQIIYDTMQIFGGRSFFTDEPFERMMRDARLNMIGEGANEVLQAFIGVVGMRDVGMQLKEGLDALKNPIGGFGSLMKFGKSFLLRAHAPTVPVKSKELAKEASRLGKGVRRFGIEVVRLLAKHREGIIEKQLLLDRVATAITALYTGTATLSFVDKELQQGNKKNLILAKSYLSIAMDRFDEAIKGLSSNDDQMIEEVADELIAKKARQ